MVKSGTFASLKCNGKAIRVGSDFSGLDTVLVGTKKLCSRIGKPVIATHACDTSRACKTLTTSLHNPQVFNQDILTRSTADLPSCDLYSFTAPCTQFSPAGCQLDVDALDGQLLFKPLEFIQANKPKAIISENSSTLKTKFRAVESVLVRALRQMGYEVQTATVNTEGFGIPQNRKRWYMIAILKTCLRKTSVSFGDKWFPEPVPGLVAISQLVLPSKQWMPLPDSGRYSSLCVNNVKCAYKKCVRAGINPFKQMVVVDMGSSTRFSSHRVDGCMTLTKTRCSGFGYWASTKGAPLNVRDMMHLQGFNVSDFGDYEALGVTQTAMAGCLGNAQSLNVVMQVLPRALFLSRLISKDEFEAMTS